jgi:hypothetical protein
VNETELAPFVQYAKGSRVGGVIVALLCFGIGALGFLDDSASIGIQLGLAIPFGLIGLAMLYLVLRPASKHPAIAVLRDRASDVVWVYSSTQNVNGVHAQTFINLALADGKQRMLAIGKQTEPEPLLRRIQASIPHATYGYSPELEAQFKRQPSALRRG